MTYDIYGIGNALVDTEVEVSDQDLAQLDVQKSIMTLIDEDKLAAFHQHFKGKEHSLACGGSAANTLIGASQLGSSCYYSCKVANDSLGNFYIQDLNENNVKTQLTTAQLPEGTTGSCMVFITPDAERSMNTYLGITSSFSTEQLNEEALKQSKYLYIEGYLLATPTSKEAVFAAQALAKKHNIKIALSFSDPFMTQTCKAEFKELLENGIDLLFCNKDEALTYTNQSTIEDAVQTLKQHIPHLAITLGADGALIVENETEHHVKSLEVKAIDTNGAGDLFAGAYLAELTQGKHPKVAAQLACFASGQLVTKFGPRLNEDTLNLVQAYKKQLFQKEVVSN